MAFKTKPSSPSQLEELDVGHFPIEKNSVALNERQKRFVLSYCGHLNASRAAREAGYSSSSGADAVTGHRLLRNDKAKAAIQALQQAKAEELELTRQDVLNAILGGIQTAREQKNPGVLIQGWVTVARLTGLDKPEPVQPRLADGKDDLRCVSTADLFQKLSEDGEYRNADGSTMQPAQIDAFYSSLSDVEIEALAEGRAKLVMKVDLIEDPTHLLAP